MDTPDKIVYTAVVTSTGGREGRAVSDDGLVDVELTHPKAMGGAGTGVNPELLFGAAYAGCFNGALGLVAKSEGVDASGSTVTARVGVGPHETSFAIAVTLEVAIPGLDLATVQDLADKAHQVCPYSKATRGNVEVTVTAVE